MKATLHILTLVIFMTLAACVQIKSKKEISMVTVDTLDTTIDKKEQERLEKRSKIEEQDYVDSLRLDKVLQDALKIAYHNISKDKFVEKYEVLQDSILVSVDINLNYHFTKANPHLIIKRFDQSAIYIDIYTKNDSEYEKVISHEQWALTYITDTIRDINGDGHKDFLVNWYPASGCCRRDVYNVYLNQPDKGKFTLDYEFINPTFSAKEKIIRGVGYGHSGEVGLYKYKWNELKVDTLEFIYPDAINKGQFIKTKKIAYRPTEKEGIVLKSVPIEYHTIESFEWFADF